MWGPNKRFKAHPMSADSSGYVDVITFVPPFSHYAFIRGLEKEYWKRQVVRYHLALECFSREWFDGLDVDNFPPVGQIAQVAGMFCTELVVSADFLRAMENRVAHRVEAPTYLYEGNWVEVHFVAGGADAPNGSVIVDTYHPAHGSASPATIGTTPNEGWAYFVDIRRVRFPSKRTDLMLFYVE
ncbi:hypothetical protein RugamoR57_07340 [Duganella caerulea]|uniref:hypothetical protein n=1 Tax=Duganella caerulea TaxID=2885762 RepID=UPI0030E7B98B